MAYVVWRVLRKKYLKVRSGVTLNSLMVGGAYVIPMFTLFHNDIIILYCINYTISFLNPQQWGIFNGFMVYFYLGRSPNRE